MKFAPIIIAAFILLSSPAWARPYSSDGHSNAPERSTGHKSHRGDFYGNTDYLKKSLGLDDAQIKQISLINSRYRKELEVFRKKLRPKKFQLREILLLDRVEYRALKQLLHEISDIETELRFLRIKHRLDIEKILTPEQKTKLRQEKRRKHRPGRHGRKNIY